MKKRITIVLDDKLYKKLRVIQAKEIQKTNKSVSFSKIINKLLQKGLK